MATWPSGTKASDTTTAADSNSISGARGDINQTITNQNAIIDTFNIGTPGASEDNKILVYNDSTGKFEIEANTSSQTPFAQEVDQNGFMLKDDSRNYQILGNTASPSSADFDSFSNTNRVHGVVNVNKVTNPANRVHSNPRLSMVTAGADSSNASNPNPGRLRQNYVEGIYDLAGFDNTTAGFGRGHNGMFVSGLLTNSTTTTSNITQSTAITITPQIDTVDANAIVVTDLAGLEVQGYCNGVGSSATNFYGFYYNAPAGDESANLGAKGLKYPTSDGSANQVIKTDGSGNLSFVDNGAGPISGISTVETTGVVTLSPDTDGDTFNINGSGGGSPGILNLAPSQAQIVHLSNAVKVSNSAPNITRTTTGQTLTIGDTNTDVSIESNNAVKFTNQNVASTPSNTSTPAAWMEVSINGATYYLPLHQ